jgi:hypothetical protein
VESLLSAFLTFSYFGFDWAKEERDGDSGLRNLIEGDECEKRSQELAISK